MGTFRVLVSNVNVTPIMKRAKVRRGADGGEMR